MCYIRVRLCEKHIQISFCRISQIWKRQIFFPRRPKVDFIFHMLYRLKSHFEHSASWRILRVNPQPSAARWRITTGRKPSLTQPFQAVNGVTQSLLNTQAACVSTIAPRLIDENDEQTEEVTDDMPTEYRFEYERNC